jgi:hypothetical protein
VRRPQLLGQVIRPFHPAPLAQDHPGLDQGIDGHRVPGRDHLVVAGRRRAHLAELQQLVEVGVDPLPVQPAPHLQGGQPGLEIAGGVDVDQRAQPVGLVGTQGVDQQIRTPQVIHALAAVAGQIVGIGVQGGRQQTLVGGHLAAQPAHRAPGGVGVQLAAIRVVIGGATPAARHRAQQQRIVVEHLLEVRDHPLGVGAVAVEPAADLVENPAAHQVLAGVLGHVEAGRIALDQQRVDEGGAGELGRPAEPSVDDVVVRPDGVQQILCRRHRGDR